MQVRLGLVTALSLPLWFDCPTLAQATDAAASQNLTVTFSMEKTSAMVGEPLLMKYAITNKTARNIKVDLGKDGVGWLSVGLESGDGAGVFHRRDRKPVDAGGFKVVPSGLLSAGQSLSGEWVIQRHFLVVRPGTYSLKPVSGVTAEDEGGHPVRVISTGGPFALTITEPTSERLGAVAADLVSQLQFSRLGDSQSTARIDALLTMPPKAAKAAWMSLATDPSWSNRWTAIAFLELSDTPEAADALAAMWENAPRNTEVSILARRALLHLLSAPSADLRKHVASIFVAREGKSPNSVEGNAVITD